MSPVLRRILWTQWLTAGVAAGICVGCADRPVAIVVVEKGEGGGTAEPQAEETCRNGERRACPDDPEAVQVCLDETFEACPCFDPAEVECIPGDLLTVPCEEPGLEAFDTSMSCEVDLECEPRWWTHECFTPLALVPDGRTPAFAASPPGAPAVALGCEGADWPTADTPWLALDRDGDGFVVPPRELLGAGSPTPRGPAENGFAALAALDANGDGRLDEADPAFPELLLWFDADADHVGLPGELVPLSAVLPAPLPLDVRPSRTCDDRGNCAIDHLDVSGGRITDLYLACH